MLQNEEIEVKEQNEEEERRMSSKNVLLPENVNLLTIRDSIKSKLPKLKKYCIGILAPEHESSMKEDENKDITIDIDSNSGL